MNKPSVALVHYTAPPVIGGVEAVIQAHAQAFVRAGYPLTVVAGWGDRVSLPPGADFVLVPEMDSKFAQVMHLSARLEEGLVPVGFDDAVSRLVELLVPVLREFDHVLVHNVLTKHFNLPLTAALHAMLDAGTIRHLIAWCHDFTWTSPSSRSKVHEGHPWDLLRTYRSDITYVVVSKERQQDLAGLFGCNRERIHTVYNGVDPKVLLGLSEDGSSLVSRLALLDADLVLLMPVRVTKAKNIEFAMRVVRALVDKGICPRLVVTGPPDPHDGASMAYFESLRALRKQLDIVDAMRFVFESGPEPEQPMTIESDVVGELFRVSDLMFMPSLREGFGMPVMEAGMVGLSVFCTNIPAAAEIGGQNVTVFDANEDPDSVAQRILDWADQDQVHGLRRRVRQTLTWQAIFEREIEPLLAR